MSKNVFNQRWNKLNKAQKDAVTSIYGPLLVIAGPGTGKTELLSMRAASILRETDALPSNILCLTFTDSGANAMRARLADIIGSDAYKVAIHTFHSFGSDIIARYREHFYSGAALEPADELTQHEIIRQILDELDYTNPLTGKNAGEYTHLRDIMSAISELKRSGLTSDEFLNIIEANEEVIDVVASDIETIFANRINMQTINQLAPLAQRAASTPQPSLPLGITPYANVLALSIAHAVDEAAASNSTKPVTSWKNNWCSKDESSKTVLKDAKAILKLKALAHVYYQYLIRMEQAGKYDYDDMILQLVHALETRPDLLADLKEQYQFIMIDEYQDTNLAQLRIALNLTKDIDNPNIMVVGDDDQAIYSFQGADINNIHRFRSSFNNAKIISLRDNYRSSPEILNASRSVIVQGADRLENSVDGLSKELTAHQPSQSTGVELKKFPSAEAEKFALAKSIKSQLDSGTPAESIAVLL